MLVNKKESLQQVKASKIVFHSQLYLILLPVRKRVRYVVENRGILEFGFWIETAGFDNLQCCRSSNLKSKIKMISSPEFVESLRKES